MPLDALCLSALTKELNTKLAEAKIDKVQQPSRSEILLLLRTQAGNMRLLLSAGSGNARIHLTNGAFENPAQPPMFCMLLRKHIAGARIKQIRQPYLERSVELVLDAPDVFGVSSEKTLILEMLGRFSNIILCGKDGIIIDCLHRVDSSMSEKRQVLPGLMYRQPPKQDKQDILSCSEDDFLRAITSDAAADKWLLNTFTGLSPLICRELVYEAYGDTSLRLPQAYAADKYARLTASVQRLKDIVSDEAFIPYMLHDAAGTPLDFSFMNIRQYGAAAAATRCESFSQMCEAYYTERDVAEQMRQRSYAVMKTVKNARDRAARKLGSQTAELAATADRDALRKSGDIITANFHLMKKGMPVLHAQDFYSENGEMCEIKLDPLKTPQQNAAKYYKDYAKARSAEKYLTQQVKICSRELEYLNSVIDELERCESQKDLAEICQELTDSGYLKRQGSGNKKSKRIKNEPLCFASSEGVAIRVGRNNSQNDELTHRLAYKSDIWLHTQKIHGSHVIISANGGSVGDKTLYEAACLAAYYSQARGSDKVPVDYTLVKNVKKPNGAKAGMVIYTDYKTLLASGDKTVSEELKKLL